ncbi:SLBB domain-containing protein [Trichocoleus sp. FACHB-591]|uniref:SLBB domain-containing protein n=1 Tax=Trichocoleus sp. FACHB-591 TaxID=2692872 RepID=UPI0018EF56E0|nr:SLBB domain-containing protein [Trichocoleus sp. FACHB-591]
MGQNDNNISFPLSQITFSLLLLSSAAAPGWAQMSLPIPATASPSLAPASLTPANAAPPSLTPTYSTPDGYQLGAGDRVRLDIFQVPEYSGEHQVLSDGSLNLPLIGTIPVQGMTLKQASAVLSAKYAPIIKRPIVTITLLGARPLKIAIAGEVSHPGSYTVSPSGEQGVPTVTRAVQLAGGITQAADTRQVQVRRARPLNVGGEQVLTVDLWQLLQTGDLRQDLLLQDGDTIFIPTQKVVNLAEANQLAAASFAASKAEPLRIAVVGQVNRPGPYTLTGNMDGQVEAGGGVQMPTVTRAIQVAGGITQSADIRRIQLRRLTKTGADQVIDVDLWKLLQAGDVRQDIPLQEGDTIAIPTATAMTPTEVTELASASFSPNKITINVVGEVVQPGVVEVPPNTPLNQGLLAAGGFNRRAKKGSVELIRLNPNGTVSRQQVAINFSKGLNDKDNPPLRNNDTIVVKRSGISGVSDAIGTVLSPLTGGFGLFRLLGL